MSIQRRSLLLAALGLSGCGHTVYFYEQKKYDSEEEFFAAVDATIRGALATVDPLPAPLTTRSLTFAIPAQTVMQATAARRFAEMQGNRSPNRIESDILRNLPISGYRNLRVFGEALQKRRIYSSVNIIDTESVTAKIEPAANMDAIYYVNPSQGAEQWYYSSAKHGQQVFAYDRTLPGPAGKIKGFLDGAQVLAIRS